MPNITSQTVRPLLPPTYYHLLAIPAGDLSHAHYHLRHPAGIFGNTLSDVMSAFSSLATLVNSCQAVGQPVSDRDGRDLARLTRDLLLEFLKYFESGYEVFLCVSDPKPRPSESDALFKWFRANGYGPITDQYFQNIDPLLGGYRRYWNALKHSSNRIQVFQFIEPTGTRSAMGFYLEGVDDKGVVSPLLAFHPMHDNRYTAWSFNLHLRRLYALIYLIATEIDTVVRGLLSSRSLTYPAQPVTSSAAGLEKLAADVYAHATRFDTAFNIVFPQESGTPLTSVTLDPATGNLTFADNANLGGVTAVGKGWRGIMRTQGDGVSKTFSLPYFNAQP